MCVQKPFVNGDGVNTLNGGGTMAGSARLSAGLPASHRRERCKLVIHGRFDGRSHSIDGVRLLAFYSAFCLRMDTYHLSANKMVTAKRLIRCLIQRLLAINLGYNALSATTAPPLNQPAFWLSFVVLILPRRKGSGPPLVMMLRLVHVFFMVVYRCNQVPWWC